MKLCSVLAGRKGLYKKRLNLSDANGLPATIEELRWQRVNKLRSGSGVSTLEGPSVSQGCIHPPKKWDGGCVIDH